MDGYSGTEQEALLAAHADRGRCQCGEAHEDGSRVTSAEIARMKAYLAANPGHQFAVDEEAGIIAVIAVDPGVGEPGQPTVLAWSADLVVLLDEISAPTAESLS